MKKLLCTFCVLALFLTAFAPLSACAYYEETPPESCEGTLNNIDWRYDAESKTMYFSDNGSEEKVKPCVKPDFSLYESSDAAIWAEIEWRPGYPWYSKNTNVAPYAEHVVFDDSLTEIIDYFCYKFESITEVTVPDSVKSIGESAFSGCSKLAVINFPESLEYLGGSAISGTAYYNDESNWYDNVLYYRDYCLVSRTFKINAPVTVREGTKVIASGAFWFYRYSTVYLPDSLERIDNRAFISSYLETVELPESLVSIGENAFANSKLTGINIPKNVSSVAYNAFDGCSCHTEITVDPENESFSAKDGVLFNKDKSEIYIYPYAKAGDYYEIPSTVKTVYATFTSGYGADRLRNLVIPKSVNKIVNPINTDNCYFMGSLNRYLTISSLTSKPKNVHTCRLKQSKKKFTYSGKRKSPRIKVYGPTGKKLKAGRDYKIILAKGRRDVGYYKTVVKLKGRFKGKIEAEYRIAPKPTSIKKVKVESTTANVRWKKQPVNITGYQLQYSVSERFSCLNEVVTIKGKNKTKYAIQNLKMGKTYYVRVRTYKNVKGEKVVSKWSKAKKFIIDFPI